MQDESEENATPEQRLQVMEEVREFLDETLDLMDLDVELHNRIEGEEVVFEFRGEDAGLAIGKKGATLDALQLLAGRVASRFPGGHRVFITLDAQGYRARREKSLTQMAERLGEQAMRQGQVITLDPLSARDRRVVHMALSQFPGVTTRSEGDGMDRRLKIIPNPGSRQ